MLEDVAGIRKVVLACGTVDLRKGIDGLAMIIGDKYNQNPFEKGTLFLFCGQRSDRIKVFFASTFWRKMQNIFGECCISKLEKVAKPRPAVILPATSHCRPYLVVTE